MSDNMSDKIEYNKNVKISGNLEVNGNLELNGTMTIINQETIVKSTIECKNFTQTDVELFNKINNEIDELRNELKKYKKQFNTLKNALVMGDDDSD